MLTPTPISIIIPTLNEETFVPLLLADLLEQSFLNYEVIISDGGSSDKTLAVAKQMVQTDSRFSILTSSKKGVSAQRNFGAQQALSNWLLFLDADTRLPKSFLTELVEQLEQTNTDAFTTFAIPDTDKISDKIFTSTTNALTIGSTFFKKPYAFGACLGFTKEIFAQVQGFDEQISFQEDAEILQRIVKSKKNFTIFPKPEYVFCMRRYQKDGTLNTILKTLPSTLHSIATSTFASTVEAYPMTGGQPYSQKK